MNFPTGDVTSIFFLLLPAALFFVFALATGNAWLFIAPLVIWPVLFYFGNEDGWLVNSFLPILVDLVGVWLGVILHGRRVESSR